MRGTARDYSWLYEIAYLQNTIIVLNIHKENNNCTMSYRRNAVCPTTANPSQNDGFPFFIDHSGGIPNN